MRSPRPTPGWSALLLVGIACQPPLIVDDDDDTYLSTASTDDAPPEETSTTRIDPDTGDPTAPTVGADTSTGEIPLPETCNVLQQDCPPGYKCSWYVSEGSSILDRTRCVEVINNGKSPLEPCMVTTWPSDGHDDCNATSYCYDVDPDTRQGICAAFCIGPDENPHCAEPCDTCYITGDFDFPCLPTCDPLRDDCPAGEACYPINDVFFCAPEGAPSFPAAGVGEPCEFINLCVSGTICLGAASVPGCTGNAGCCSPVCNPAAAFDPCPSILPGTVCTHWYDPDFGEPFPGCDYDPPGVCAAP